MLVLFGMGMLLIGYYWFLKCHQRAVAFSPYFYYVGIVCVVLSLCDLCTPFKWWQGMPLFLKTICLGGLLVFLGAYLLFLRRCFQAHKQEFLFPPDIIFVFGAGLFGDQMSLALKSRLDVAYQLALDYPLALIVVSGGQGEDEWISEAEAMASYLEKRGIAHKRIIQENKSTSTYENLAFSKDFLSFDGKKTVLVSNQFHLYRARKIAKKLGIDGYGVSAHLKSIALPVFYTREFFACIKGLLYHEM